MCLLAAWICSVQHLVIRKYRQSRVFSCPYSSTSEARESWARRHGTPLVSQTGWCFRGGPRRPAVLMMFEMGGGSW
ncbi:hypothetical protein VTH06DRAFT_148 [Thermothelomyces fergusii]